MSTRAQVLAEGVKRRRLAGMQVYFRPRVFTMMLLGFSSGLPFLLTGNTLGYWLRDEGISLTAIGLLSSAYQLGYRGALLVAESLILIPASHLGWPIAYGMMAALMAVGIFGTSRAAEPRRAGAGLSNATASPVWSARGFFDAVIGP